MSTAIITGILRALYNIGREIMEESEEEKKKENDQSDVDRKNHPRHGNTE